MLVPVAEVPLIAFTEIVLGHGGLPACGHCGAQSRTAMRSAAHVVEDLRLAARSWSQGPGPNVVLGGAEPFLHPELPSIVTAARASGVRRLMITSGGEALAVGQNAMGSLDAGVRLLELVLLAGAPAPHDDLLGRQGAYEAALAGARAFLSAAALRGYDIALFGRVPVCRHNTAHVAGAGAALGALGASAVFVDMSTAADVAPAAGWFDSVADTGMVNRTWAWFSGSDPGASVSAPHLAAPWSLTAVAT